MTEQIKMDINDFIELCKKKVAQGQYLKRRKFTSKLLGAVKGARGLSLKQRDSGLIAISKEEKIRVNNGTDIIVLQMNIHISPVEKFFWVYYTCTGILANRKVSHILFDTLEFFFYYPEYLNGIFEKEPEEVSAILRYYGYTEIPYRLLEQRIDLYPTDRKVKPIDKLGGQSTLERILEYGLEYSSDWRKGYYRLELDIDQELVDIASEVISLSQHAYRLEGNICISNDIKVKDHSEAIKIIENICQEYGGERMEDSSLAYRWDLGTAYRDDGDIRIQVAIMLYLSKYTNSYYIKAEEKIIVHCHDDIKLEFKDCTVGDDVLLLVDMVNQYYACDEKLLSQGIFRQKDVSYTIELGIRDESGKYKGKENVEIGQLLFGLTKKECYFMGCGDTCGQTVLCD